MNNKLMHKSLQIRKTNSYFFLFACVIVQLFFAESATFTEYNFTFDLPTVQLTDLSLKNDQNNNVEHLNGEMLIKFLVKQPKQIDNVFQIVVRLKDGTEDKISAPTQINKDELLSAPDIEGIWFDTYVWPIRKNSLSYFLDKQKSDLNAQEKIVSAAYVSLPSQTLSSNVLSSEVEVYALLSTGQIQWILKNHEILQLQKIYKFQPSHQGQQQKEWNEAKLYHKNERLYLLTEENIFLVSLNEIDDGSQKKVFYRLVEMTTVGKAFKVVQTAQQLFVFTEKGCFKLKDKQSIVVIKQEDIIQTFPEAHKGFVDFAIFADNLYFLSKELGIVIFSPSSNYSLLRIQHPQFSKQISIYNHTILITYKIGIENYIQEYHFVQQHGKLYINKIYNHHSEEEVSGIILFDRGMIVNRGAQVVIGMHSLSRNFPYVFHKKGSVIDSQTFSSQVMQLRAVQSSILQLPGYMIVTQNSIELIQFESHTANDFPQKWVSITSQRKGTFDFEIQFIGTCKNSQFYRSQYCSITKSIQMQINDSTGELIHSWRFWVGIAGGSILLIIIVFVVSCKYFAKKQNQFESLIQGTKLRNNASTIVEMSVENNTEIN